MAQFSNRRRWGLMSNPLPDKPWFRDTIPRGRSRLEMYVTKGLAISSSKSTSEFSIRIGRTHFRAHFHLHQILDFLTIWFMIDNTIKIENCQTGPPSKVARFGPYF
jgi:hypothetical protein